MQKQRGSLIFKIIGYSLLALIILAFTSSSWMTGGAYAVSPNGRYCLHVTTALNPNYFSYYRITLQRRSPDIGAREITTPAKKSNQSQDEEINYETVETLTLRPRLSPVSCPRGHPKPVRWSAESDFVDVYIDDKPLCRIFVPN